MQMMKLRNFSRVTVYISALSEGGNITIEYPAEKIVANRTMFVVSIGDEIYAKKWRRYAF